MQIELNLWFSAKTGNVFGNLNINMREEVQKISKLMPIQEFYKYSINKKIYTEQVMNDFLNDSTLDQQALYGWSEKNNLIIWNKQNAFADVIYNDEQIRLQMGIQRRQCKGMPDIYFRG